MNANETLFKMDVSFLKSHETKQAPAGTGGSGWWHHPQINNITVVPHPVIISRGCGGAA